jgi:anti-sigma28 factor (negative regulator of flagellin synthesis)
MRDPSARRWHRWRFALRRESSTELVNRLLTPVAAPADATECEQPGPDGIRHELVARVRREIAAGTYDTEEKWLAAEAELLRRIEERM